MKFIHQMENGCWAMADSLLVFKPHNTFQPISVFAAITLRMSIVPHLSAQAMQMPESNSTVVLRAMSPLLHFFSSSLNAIGWLISWYKSGCCVVQTINQHVSTNCGGKCSTMLTGQASLTH